MHYINTFDADGKLEVASLIHDIIALYFRGSGAVHVEGLVHILEKYWTVRSKGKYTNC